jgi:hypothetical protein
MLSRGLTILALATLPLTAAAGHKKYRKADVRFLASSTSVRSSIADNQDVYLVKVRLADQREPSLARLVDTYPPYQTGLSERTLTAPDGAHLKVRRDQSCDTAFGRMLLRTAPGSMLAILPERLDYQPNLPSAIALNQVLPCYRVVRKSNG